MPQPDPASDHDHARCIEDALRNAAALYARRGTRLTALRRRLLELVWQRHAAVKAYDLLDELGAAGKPPTVCRALEFLIAHVLTMRRVVGLARERCLDQGHGKSP